jgi:hypothetical protein
LTKNNIFYDYSLSPEETIIKTLKKEVALHNPKASEKFCYSMIASEFYQTKKLPDGY